MFRSTTTTLPFSEENWDLLVREAQRLQAEIEHQTLRKERGEQSTRDITQKLSETLTKIEHINKERQEIRAISDDHKRNIAALTAQIAKERLNRSAMRDTMEACTRMMERAGRE